MITTSMISEGEDIASKMDAVYGETALPGSHHGLGSSAMLHHECRHMAAHLGSAGEKTSTIEERPEKAALRQVDRITNYADIKSEMFLMTSQMSLNQFGGGDDTQVYNRLRETWGKRTTTAAIRDGVTT